MTERNMLVRAITFDETPYLAAQVALMQRNLPLAMLAAAMVAVMVAVMHHTLAHDVAVHVWGVLAVLVSTVGALIARRKVDPQDAPMVRHQARLLQAVAAAQGLVWGALAWGFMHTPESHTTNLVMGATAGLTSGGMVLFAPVWPMSVAYLLLSIPPAVWVLLGSPNPHDQVLGVASAIYLVAMLVFSYFAARAVRESIAVRFENAQLVERLRDQTQRAFDARQMAEEAQAEAEEANHAKGVFLAAASHDLRQPLHALGLFASTLSASELSTHQRQLLEQIDRSAQAAREMLGTLLDFSKVDAGVERPKPRPFALQALLLRLEHEFAPQAVSRGLAYRTHSTQAVAMADAGMVERILRNLIGNALKYTDRGGVLVGVRRRGAQVVIEVWDSGVGIPADQHRAIFREFHQLGNPERDRRKGLGLGLAIAEGLARSMNVSVGLASRPGRGSVFRLTLPLSREALLPQGELTHEAGDLCGARVLVVDDDEGVRSSMAELLTSWGAWVEVVESLPDALAVLVRFMPQVIVADYRLRGPLNGQEVIERLRSAAHEPIPAMVVTGDTAAQRLREAHASGLCLLHKPVPAAKLHASLVSLLKGAVAQGVVAQVAERGAGPTAG